VETDATGLPVMLMSTKTTLPWRGAGRPARAGRRQAVALLRRPWRVDQLWWRPGEAVSRRYFRVAPADGPPITLYQDLLSGRWYQQEY
jgi:hypothetical protein